MYGYIYKTIDKKNGKIYIGQHKSEVFDKRYNGSGTIIKHIKKKRPQDLYTEIIEWCETKSQTNEREKYWITTFDSQNPQIGYNITEGGDGAFGYKHTEDKKQKISEKKKGCHLSETHKKQISEKMKGRHLSETHKNHISESNKGRHLSETHKNHISESNKGKKIKEDSICKMVETRKRNGTYKHSEETKKKISESGKGRHTSEETKKKMVETRIKNNSFAHSEETKKKISEANKGKTKGIRKSKHIYIDCEYNMFQMNNATASRHHPDWILVE